MIEHSYKRDIMTTTEIKEKASDENDLVQRFRAGEEPAFNALYEQYFLRVYFYTFNLINDQQEAKAIVSDTFTKLWQLRQNFKTLPDIRGFLYRVCRNQGFDFLKYRYHSKQEILTEDVQQLFSQDIVDQDMISQVAHTEILHSLYKEIKNLPPQRQEVLRLFFVEGLSAKEIAKKLRMTEVRVRSVKAKALNQLRSNIGPLNITLLCIALLHLPHLAEVEILNY